MFRQEGRQPRDNAVLILQQEEHHDRDDDEIDQHVKRDSSDDDDVFEIYKLAAFESVQKFLRRPILRTVYELSLDEFPFDTSFRKEMPFNTNFSSRAGQRAGFIDIPLPPLVSVDLFTYTDTNGDAQTLVSGTDFQVDTRSVPGRVSPASGKLWPPTQIDRMNSLVIKFTCGWTVETVPPLVKSGILIQLANLYKNRDTIGTSNAQIYDLTEFVKQVLGPYQNRFTT